MVGAYGFYQVMGVGFDMVVLTVSISDVRSNSGVCQIIGCYGPFNYLQLILVRKYVTYSKQKEHIDNCF